MKFIIENSEKIVMSVSDFIGEKVSVQEAIKLVEHYFECPMPEPVDNTIAFTWKALTALPFTNTTLEFPLQSPNNARGGIANYFGSGMVSFMDINMDVWFNPIKVKRIIMQFTSFGARGISQAYIPLTYVNRNLAEQTVDEITKTQPLDPYQKQNNVVVYNFKEEDNFILGQDSQIEYNLSARTAPLVDNGTKVKMIIQYYSRISAMSKLNQQLKAVA